MPNQLIDQKSPYLLQHAQNPVDWYPWGEEALGRAVKEDKPILLSIGYSACHWCHVMERESFENEEIARIMNQNFVNIKVDREERPDLDAVYMEAVSAITGGGGWPLTVFLTPEREPFFGGTYFPPENRNGLPGFPTVLQTVSQAYKYRKGEVDSAARQIVSRLNQSAGSRHDTEPLNKDILCDLYAQLLSAFDRQHGGLGSSPKFPHPMIFEFLLRYHHRHGDRGALLMVEHTLKKMAKGGIYDQVGGGFHRYSVDASWNVPHFEKMLYDNALLGRLYLHAYQVTGEDIHRRIAEEILDYVLREMTDEQGGFYSSQDADSEGIEGRYYIWTTDEVMRVLGAEDGDLLVKYYSMTEDGDFEGFNILSPSIEITDFAVMQGLKASEVERRIGSARARLLESRAGRVPPLKDRKVLADWNGLMLATFAEAAAVLDRDDYLEAAVTNASFLTTILYDGEILKHSFMGGETGANGYLSDYALVGEGFLALYEDTFDEKWLAMAIELAEAGLRQFWSEAEGCFYDTGYANEALVVHPKNVFDNAVPSGSSAMVFLLLRLARLTGSSDYERIALVELRAIRDSMVRYPSGFGHWLCALDLYLSKPREIAVIGNTGESSLKTMLDIIYRRYLPNRVLAGKTADKSAGRIEIPLLAVKTMIDSMPTVYVCENNICKPPVTDASALENILEKS